MDGAGDMVWVAVPFAAGVSAGAVLVVHGALGPGVSGVLAVCCLVPAAGLVWSLRTEGLTALKVACTALLCGLFCYLSWHSRGAAAFDGPVQRLAQGCVEELRARIDRLPYGSGQSGALVKALLTGDRSGLERETVATFRRSGASHLLALSGLHLGFIYLIIRRLSALIPWRGPRSEAVRAGAVTALCGFYTLMTGAGPSIVRAFLFILINELAGISPGRRREPGRTLLSALTIQLAISPGVVSTVGFQLSYLAMAGIIWIFPRLDAFWPGNGSVEADGLKSLRRRLSLKGLWTAASLSISCQITTAPLAWWRFHSFPRYFLITNLLAMPLTSAVMALSIAVLALSACGLCPLWLAGLNDSALQLLLRLLQIISSM